MELAATALPIIVSNYARRFGVKVRMQGCTAYTNGKSITIPRLNLNDPRKARCAYGYLAHEAAHIRYTNFRYVKAASGDALLSALFNVLEDARVETLIGREFIGVWENLQFVRDALKSDIARYIDEMGSKSTLHIFLSALIFYLGAHCQRFVHQRTEAAALLRELRARLGHRQLNALLAVALKLKKAKNSSQTLKLARTLYRQLATIPGTFNGSSYGIEQDLNTLIDLIKQDAGASTLEECSCGELGQVNGADPRFVTELQRLLKSTDSAPLQSVPGANPAAVMEDLVDRDTTSRDDFGLLEPGKCQMGRRDFLSTISGTHALRAALTRRVRAYSEFAGSHIERGHKLNPYRLSLIRVGETRIFYDKVVEDDNSTSVHILTDVSGSMLTYDDDSTSRCEAACQSALSLGVALEGIDGIKTMVTYFPGRAQEFDVVLREHERASLRAPYFDQRARGSTPLAQCLWHAIGRVKELDCKRNIIMVITDGIPDSVEQARTALNAACDHAIEVYGIGICLDFIGKLIPNSVVIRKPSQLQGAMFRLFNRIFDPEMLRQRRLNAKAA